MVAFLFLHDLRRRNDSVADLYSRTSNEHAVTGLSLDLVLRYPVGEATAEEELVAAYREFFGLRGQTSIDERALRPIDPRYGGGFLHSHVTAFLPRLCPMLNRPPEVVGLADRTAGWGGASWDVRAGFRDPDGQTLTYAAVSSSPEVAGASMAPAPPWRVRVDPVYGAPPRSTVTVTVTAADPYGLSASESFAVTLANRAPLLLRSIPPLALRMEDPTGKTVDVSDAFRDQDGGARQESEGIRSGV